MSRLFANGGADYLTVTPTNVIPNDQGPMTIMALVKMTAAIGSDQWIIQAYNSSGNPAWGLLASGGKFFNEGNFGSGNGATVLNAWMWVCWSKQSGNVAPRWHFKNLTAATAWSHANDAALVQDGNGPPVNLVLGGRSAGSAGFQGNIAAIGVWNRVLADTEIEAAAVSGRTFNRAHPQYGVLFNQASTSTAVTDLSAYAATQATVVGTTVSADEAPSWDYTVGAPPEFMMGRTLPGSMDVSDGGPSPYTLGTIFTPTVSGVVTHVKYFVPVTPNNVASAPNIKIGLFGPTGTLLGSRTFNPNDWDTGNWADFPFTTPVAVTAGTQYTIALFTPDRYTVTSHYYDTSFLTGHLAQAVGAGVFDGTWDLTYPTQTYNNNNYNIDVIFFSNTDPSSTPTLKVWNGTAEVSATITVWNGSTEVAASLSAIV